jgi:monoamine oxidase
VLNCFAGSPTAVARLVAGDWPGRVAELRAELAPQAGEALLTTWADGAYSTSGLASRPEDEALLQAPAGPLHFAGEHTAGAWHGLMEGALRSGRRAARELLSR